MTGVQTCALPISDIITGQGASQNIIDEATTKLQEINEAYEIIKKNRGI